MGSYANSDDSTAQFLLRGKTSESHTDNITCDIWFDHMFWSKSGSDTLRLW